MKLKILAFVAVMGIPVSGPANAAFYTGSDLLFECESESGVVRSNCASYIAGIVDAHSDNNVSANLDLRDFCMPVGATLGQLEKVFIKYANENPQSLHYDAAGQVRRAFSKSFPCK